jgi:hypothetical protein
MGASKKCFAATCLGCRKRSWNNGIMITFQKTQHFNIPSFQAPKGVTGSKTFG